MLASCPARFLVFDFLLQVSVESPEVLVPLVSSLGSAWIWTLDQRVGLFSGSQHQQVAEESGAGGGHLVKPGEADSPVVQETSMLQV